MSHKARAALAPLCLTLVLALAGCASSPQMAEENQVVSEIRIPDTNPWKADFIDEYERTSVSFVKSVLADGNISDAEHAEMSSRYVACLKGFGLESTPQGKGGAETVKTADGREHVNLEAEIEECSESSGQSVIAPLYIFTKANPENEDSMALLLNCLKKRKAVDPGLSIAEFENLHAQWEYMDSLGEHYEICTTDPSGLL